MLNCQRKSECVRVIERKQNLKENLFLVLLQKREEAAINVAVTAPSIKVIDYALSSGPTAPKQVAIYGVSAFAGLIIPFAILFLLLSLDNKIYQRKDLEKGLPDIPIAGEIPHIPQDPGKQKERSELSESFRILVTNIKFLLKNKSSEEENGRYGYLFREGGRKTLLGHGTRLGLSSSLHLKSIACGWGPSKPQAPRIFGGNAQMTLGFLITLSDPEIRFKDCIQRPDKGFQYLNVCFSGPIPPNAPQLLSGERYSQFLEEARNQFDVVIVDTAPTVLVTDSLIMDDLVDLVLYVVRPDIRKNNLSDTYKTSISQVKCNGLPCCSMT